MDSKKINWMSLGEPFSEEKLKRKVEGFPIKLLIAEDNESIRQMVKQILTSSRYEIVEAIDGEQAWQILKNNEDPPRIAILDWMMPKIDGLSLCRKIKAREEPFIFTIMLTARVSDQDILTTIEAGADDFLPKPFNLNVLRVRVAAGEHIIRLEKLSSIKSEILEYYIKKVEDQAREKSG